GALDAAARQERLVFAGGVEPTLNLGAVFAERLDGAREFGLVEEDGGLGVIEDGGKLGAGEPNVERHHDSANERRAIVALQELVGIEAEEGHPVADGNTFAE